MIGSDNYPRVHEKGGAIPDCLQLVTDERKAALQLAANLKGLPIEQPPSHEGLCNVRETK